MIGALIVDKPEGPTSHDIINSIRRAAGTRRVGHIGTLDPFATGVLVVLVGQATRLSQFLTGLDKEYTAVVRLGFATDTQDRTGSPLDGVVDVSNIDESRVESVLRGFCGPQRQMPPMYSAKKVQGRRLYQSARAGIEVDREPVEITIHEIEMLHETLKRDDEGMVEFTMRVLCSSGTYVRTIANDIGERLGVGGHLSELRRVKVGQFWIEQAVTLDEIRDRAEKTTLENVLVKPVEMLKHLDKLELDAIGVKKVRNGVRLEVPVGNFEGEFIRLCEENGELIAVGRVDPEEGTIRPHTVLASL
jgi:tRNA pseudouridine55 synthase